MSNNTKTNQTRTKKGRAARSRRHIARELAVSILPQLTAGGREVGKLELDQIIERSVSMMREHAQECLTEADALRQGMQAQLLDIQIEHPQNADRVRDLLPVQVSTAELQDQLSRLERAVHLVFEALDMPQALESTLSSGARSQEMREFISGVVNMYLSNRPQIDDFIRHAKGKWKIERMVSIDRDILRLACAEALFAKDVPIPVCINEAVELTLRFADERAAKYINGILGDLAAEASIFRRTGKFSFAEGD